MPSINKSVVVPYSPAQMYTLVNDINAYPEFINWCEKSEILSQDADEIKATLHLSVGGLQKSFTTRNRLQPNKMIEMRLVDGPFHHLEGFWIFETDGDNHCKIRFELEFEFSNKLMGIAAGPVFSQMTLGLVDAFSQRAQEVYGT